MLLFICSLADQQSPLFMSHQWHICAKQLHTSMTGANCLSGIRFEHADLWSSGVKHQLLLRSFFGACSVGSSGLITSTVGGPGFRGSQGKLGEFISRFIALYGWPTHVEGNSKDWDIGWVAGHMLENGLNPHVWRLKLHSLIPFPNFGEISTMGLVQNISKLWMVSQRILKKSIYSDGQSLRTYFGFFSEYFTLFGRSKWLFVYVLSTPLRTFKYQDSSLRTYRGI